MLTSIYDQVSDTRGTYSSNPLNVSTAGFDAVDAILGPLSVLKRSLIIIRTLTFTLQIALLPKKNSMPPFLTPLPSFNHGLTPAHLLEL